MRMYCILDLIQLDCM